MFFRCSRALISDIYIYISCVESRLKKNSSQSRFLCFGFFIQNSRWRSTWVWHGHYCPWGVLAKAQCVRECRGASLQACRPHSAPLNGPRHEITAEGGGGRAAPNIYQWEIWNRPASQSSSCLGKKNKEYSFLWSVGIGKIDSGKSATEKGLLNGTPAQCARACVCLSVCVCVSVWACEFAL